MKNSWLTILLAACLLAGAETSHAAKVQLHLDSWAGPPLRVFITRPSGLEPDRPVVFVMHGLKRKAREYRDQWHELALEHDFLLVVPEFRQTDFPGARAYELGNVFDLNSDPVPQPEWSFSAIEAIFEDVRRRFSLNAKGYALYGHSAGAQFVHRFLLHVPGARLNRAVAADARWYTMPDFDIKFPYGLMGSAVGPEQLAMALQHPLTILLREADTGLDDPSLSLGPEALAQGPDRMARGNAFYDAARIAAENLGVPFQWQLHTVKGVGRDVRLMALAAVPYLLTGSPPPSVP